jgi:bifunctional DNase/RNase
MIRTIIDSVKVSQEIFLYMVTLREQQGKRSLHMFVESDEAKAIAAAMGNKVIGELSKIHDLLHLVIKGLSAKVSMIVVSDCKHLKDKASLFFTAKIFVIDGVKEFTTVCNATDAIAIAILTQAPIFVEESVMDMSNSDSLTQARVDELSWLGVEDLFELKSGELPSSTDTNRMLLSVEDDVIGQEVELVVSEVLHSMLDYQNVVILTDKQQKWNLPIWVGQIPSYAIDNLIHNISLPDSHQLLREIVEGCQSVVSMAFISDLRKNVWRAQLIFGRRDGCFGVECRPSDAIITALTASAPIYARKSLLNTEGIPRGEAHKD